MDYFLLSRWEAVELFCEVISKSGERRMDDFLKSNKYVDHYLDKLSVDTASREFAQKHFSEYLSPKETVAYPNIMRFLSQGINDVIPFVISEGKLKFIINYIEKDVPVEQIRFTLKRYNIYNRKKLDDKQRVFEKTYWWFYFHCKLTDENKSEVIVKCVLSMLPFGRSRFVRSLLPDEQSTDDIQTYVGTYTIYGKNEDQLRLSYKTEKNDRDNVLLVYIGDKAHPIAIGIYDTNFRFMSCGPACIERIDDLSVIKEIEAGNEKQFLDFKISTNSDFGDIRPAIRDFLMAGKSFDVAKGINNWGELSNWLNRSKK